MAIEPMCSHCESSEVSEGLPDIPQNRDLWARMELYVEPGAISKAAVDDYIAQNRVEYDRWLKNPVLSTSKEMEVNEQ